ncbi:MAG TPA: YraN family protein [Acidobacteriaceae bacterium]|nr:YraN family protein [Acidobacteriaceae bacterium]
MFLSFRLNLLESAVDALARSGERRSVLPSHLATGLRGERAAFFWLRHRGYLVVARQWHSSRAPGDLDLIAWQGDTLCFIEVKTRTTRAVAAAHFAVDASKRRVLRRLARHYLRQLPRRATQSADPRPSGPATRFDILSIYFEQDQPAAFEHYPGAFGWEEAES